MCFTKPNNVILTPHIGGSTQEAQKNIALDVGNKIVDYLKTGNENFVWYNFF